MEKIVGQRPSSFLEGSKMSSKIISSDVKGWSHGPLDKMDLFEACVLLGNEGYRFHSREQKGDFIIIYFDPPEERRQDSDFHPKVYKSESF